jgi:hypothetical protein
MHPIAVPLTLRIPRGGSYWRLHEQDQIEVWRGLDCLGRFSGAVLAIILEQHLLFIDVQAKLAVELQAPQRPLVKAPARCPAAPMLSDAERAKRRAARRGRK